MKTSGFAPLSKPIQRIFFESTASLEPTLRKPTQFPIFGSKCGKYKAVCIHILVHIHNQTPIWRHCSVHGNVWRNIGGGEKSKYCVINTACLETFMGAKLRWCYIRVSKDTNKRIKNTSLRERHKWRQTNSQTDQLSLSLIHTRLFYRCRDHRSCTGRCRPSTR